MKVWSTRLTAALAIALGITACSTADLFDLPGGLGIDDGASAGEKESLKVEASMEARLELATGAALTVPKGAVDHEVMIGVERPTDAKSLDLVETLKSVKAVASAPYVLTPHGTQFAKDVRLEIPINKGKDGPLVVAWLKDENDREWKVLEPATIEGDVAIVTLKHFSVIVVLDGELAGLDGGTSDDADAGTSEDVGGEDAGASTDPRGDDAGSALDAGVTSPASADAGSVRDGGSDAKDAAAQALPDASATTSPVDAGRNVDTDASQASDAGSSQQSDASTSAGGDSGSGQTDAALNVDADVPLPDAAPTDAGFPADADADAGASPDGEVIIIIPDVDAAPDPDAGAYVDAGTDTDGAPPTCVPLPCYGGCGTMPDGCGATLDCGDCGQTGGVCGLYEPNVCGLPIQL